jgi:uncharacterized protein YpbB
MVSKVEKERENDSTQMAHIILRAVEQLKLGSIKTAEFLRASKSIDIRHLQKQPGYGGLYWLSITQIRGLIEQLTLQKYVQQQASVQGKIAYPILIVTKRGEDALKNKESISLTVPKIVPIITIYPTHGETKELFLQGNNPQVIAQKRNLAISTIYGHLADLVAKKELKASQLVSDSTILEIKNAAKQLSEEPTVKRIKELLPQLPYEIIRIVVNDLNANKEA